MKVVNVVLSILILLLAIASAVFSFFLFDKRGQLVDGWNKMATAINQTASAMDQGSGTTLATELTTENLGHGNYDSLDGKLPKLAEGARQVITQRDKYADAMRTLGGVAEVKNVGAEDAFRNLATYPDNINVIVRGVTDAINNRTNIIRQFCNYAASNLKIQLDANKIIAGDRAEIGKLEAALKEVAVRRSLYESHLKTSAKHADKDINFPATGKYDDQTKAVSAAVGDLKKRYTETTGKLNAANQTITQRDQAIRQRDGQIAGLKKTVADRDSQLNDLKKVLGIPDDQQLPVPWKDGSVEARKAIFSKVIEVNTRYGYITVDFGAETVVIQPIGNKEAKINPMIQPGMDFVVARGPLDNPKAEFLARVILVRVDANTAIANFPANLAKPFQVGDVVYFEPAAEEPAAK